MDGVEKSSCIVLVGATASSILSLSMLAGDTMSKAELLRSEALRMPRPSSPDVTSWSISESLLCVCEGPSSSVSSVDCLEASRLLESGRGDSVCDREEASTSSTFAVDDPGSACAGSGDEESLSTCISSRPSWSGRHEDVDARSSSGHEELCDRGGSSGGGLLDGVGIVYK